MTHSCENCGDNFEIERHHDIYLNNTRYLQTGTGKNMVYRGDMNREYAICPGCGAIENQWSAEDRDQAGG